MYKALIVEDEPNIRNGMIRHHLWKELGFESVLSADDGASGLALVRREPRIRLILTDIRMKKISGLEFIRQLYEQESFTGKVIILSGYDDFQYARTAMTFGVVDYLLKPVDTLELKHVIGRAMDQLEREEGQLDHLRMIEHAMPKLKEQLLNRILESPGGDDAQLQKELHAYGLAWLFDCPTALMVIEPDNLRSVADQGGTGSERLILFAIGNVVEYSLHEYEREGGSYVMFRSTQQDKWLILFDMRQRVDGSDWTWLDGLEAALRERIKRYVKISASITFASGGQGASLHALHEEAQDKLTRTRLYGYAEDAAEWNDAVEKPFREVDMLSGAQALADLISHGERDDVEWALSQFPLLVREWGIDKLRDLHRKVFEWLLEIFEAVRKTGWKQDHWRRNPLRLWEHIQTYDTVEALQGLVAGYLLQANEELRESPRNQVLQKAERYIQAHFAEQLTVQVISEHVYVTPEWLSTLFKKNFDLTVLDYITRLRMEQAKSLLQDVGLKIYQISGLVGYKDSVYFSRLFKKHTGLTPKEFRNQRGIPADE
ncbi:response regulator [Paenibacillus sp. R14(2021)]|uniref:response regulator n=1 Tax=Paenibacillus sp. R14(2021) TaxID=2859228 RepID=UPI001C6121BB|nr:response regulator [Paenibacillus sp. R14(2021)]